MDKLENYNLIKLHLVYKDNIDLILKVILLGNTWKFDGKITKLKFIYSEKATNFCEISTIDLSYVVTIKSTVKISQNFVAFPEYINFKLNKVTTWDYGWKSTWY